MLCWSSASDVVVTVVGARRHDRSARRPSGFGIVAGDAVGARLVRGAGQRQERQLAGTSSPLPGIRRTVGDSGSSACSGTNTVPPPFVTRSKPWSKNWPKNVNIELNGADRPTSGASLPMKQVASGRPSRGIHPIRATAAGLVVGLIDDDVADECVGPSRRRCPWSGCSSSTGWAAAAGAVEIDALALAIDRFGHTREDRVRSAEIGLAGGQVVHRTVDGAQAEWQAALVDLSWCLDRTARHRRSGPRRSGSA